MTIDSNDIANYDYELPPELIAATPPVHRGDSRLLLVDRQTREISHHEFRELPELLSAGDRLVLNDSRVLPARLRGARAATGGKWEGLFLKEFDNADWMLLGQTRGRLQAGETLLITSARHRQLDPLRLHLKEKLEQGAWRVSAESEESAFALLAKFGDVPLPPYIRKGIAKSDDLERYQTVYARAEGSVAAPTAGLHFTQDLIDACGSHGIQTSYLTLHVGIGTFRPVTAERLEDHVMHAEYGDLPPATANDLANTRAAGGRIVAVGTTSVRVLETAARQGAIAPFQGETSLFIRPPYQFRAVDVLLTNFHLPRSTLLVLVSTFAGRDLIRQAYAEAIRQRYRFFSYGDAMLIL